MPKRTRLYPYHRSTFVEAVCAVLSQVGTTDAQGDPVGLDKRGAVRFLNTLSGYAAGAINEMKAVVLERDDDAPIEVSADLLDRLTRAVKQQRRD